MQLLRGLTRGVESLAISPDSRFVVATSWWGGCSVWDLDDAKPKPRPLPPADDDFSKPRFLSPVHFLVCVGEQWWRHDLAAGTQSEVALPTNVLPDFAIAHPSGNLFKTISPSFRRVVTVTLTESGLKTVGQPFRPPDYPSLIAFDPDGGCYLLLEGLSKYTTYRCHLRDTASDRIVTTFAHPEGRPFQINDTWRFTPDGRRLFVMSRDCVTVCDCEAGGPPILTFARRRASQFQALAVHPDGRRVATVEDHRTVTLRDADTLQPLRSYDFAMPRITCVAFTPDGTRCVIGNSRGKVLLFDVD